MPMRACRAWRSQFLLAVFCGVAVFFFGYAGIFWHSVLAIDELVSAHHGFPGVPKRCWRKHKGGRYGQSYISSACCHSSCVTGKY